MTVTVKHSKTNAISDWTQAQLDEQIALGNFAEGTVLADIVLPSDWNDDHTLTGIGTMAEQNANNVAITGGTINNTSIGATTASTGKFTTVTANTSVSIGANTTAVTPLTVSSEANANNARGIAFNIATTAFPYARINVPSGSGGALGFFASDGTYEPIEQFRVNRTVSAVNYVQVTGATTTNWPSISAQGSDTNVTMSYISKGSGVHVFGTNGASSNTQLRINHVASAVNYATITGSATTNAIPFSVAGTDTNISMAFQPKGTGAIDLAAGSSGVNISNGGTVTAVTRTNVGVGYTSVPTITISAPTTAGGVQATASVTSMGINFVTVVSGGTGYAVNDEILISGGTFTTQARYRITAVSGGVVTTLTPIATPNYQALPTNPASTTTDIGTGTGLTLNINWAVTGQSITNAGSGYIEQPTVSFSGGGGSGAAAYASIGANPIIKSLAGGSAGATSLSLFTSGGEVLRLTDTGATSVNAWRMQGASTNGSPQLLPAGSDTNIGGLFSSKGTSSLTFYTNSFAQTQFLVSHTASAVNYVQVTGSATGGQPNISAQGSDGNIGLNLKSKGTFNIILQNGAGNNGLVVNMTSGTTLANYVEVAPKIAGTSPTISALGSDTNIDLSLTTKGTGAVRLNTGGGLQMQVADRASAVNYLQITGGAATQAAVFFTTQGTDTNIGYDMRGKGAGTYWFSTGSAFAPQMTITNTASAVNYVQVTGSATGAAPLISAQGSDATVGLTIQAKGTNAVNIGNGNLYRIIEAVAPASSVNRIQISANITNTSPFIAALGTDTNIDLTLTPKGTGVVQFGTHTANADTAISGYITIRDAGGTLRKLAVIT